MIVVAPMRDLIVMIEGRSSRDHEAIPQEPQKRVKQEPQIEMVLKLFTIFNRLDEFLDWFQENTLCVYDNSSFYLIFHFYSFSEKSSTQNQQHQLEGKSILQKRSKPSKNYTVEHHVKGILSSLVVKSHQKDKQVIQFSNHLVVFRPSKNQIIFYLVSISNIMCYWF